MTSDTMTPLQGGWYGRYFVGAFGTTGFDGEGDIPVWSGDGVFPRRVGHVRPILGASGGARHFLFDGVSGDTHEGEQA